jgi:putative nucleotidyltransferase with HDIG domain
MSNAAKSSSGLESFDDSQMTDVSKDFFFEGMSLPVPVYMKMGPNSYLVIGKKGDKAAFSNLHAYNKPNVNVYVQKNDQPMLIAYVTQLTGKIVSQKAVPESTKIKFLSSLATDAMDSLAKSNFTSIAKIQKVAQLVQQLSQNVSAFDELLTILTSLYPAESKHAMTTCLVSLMIGEEMHMNQPVIQEKLILGALLHDVGMKYVPRSILEKPRHQWTPEELTAYEQHPLKGADMLREIKEIPQDVLLIIAEHHENAQATGFPKKMRDVKISPLARIVSVANCFANLLFGSLAQSKCYTPDEAILYIEEVQGQPYNRQVFSALKNIINKKHLSDKTS